MKRFWIAGVMGLALTGVAAGCAGTKEARRDVEGAIPGIAQTGEGVVETAGTTELTVVGINEDPTPISFAVTPETQVERDGQRVELSSLQPGTPVKVWFEPAAGPERAHRIQVLTGPEAARVRTRVEDLGYGGAGFERQMP